MTSLRDISQKEDDLRDVVASFNEEEHTELWQGISSHIVEATIIEAAAPTPMAEGEQHNSSQVVSVCLPLCFSHSYDAKFFLLTTVVEITIE